MIVFENFVVIALALTAIALALVAVFQLPRLLLRYEITDTDIRVLLLQALPIYRIPFRTIQTMREAPFPEVAFMPGVHLFTRLFARRVVIEMRDKWFVYAFLTPNNPAAFIAEVKRRMASA